MRIDKILSNMGVGSRKEVKAYLKNGFVQINGVTVTKATVQVDPDIDKITFKNKDLIYEQYTYIMMNKPQGYISATEGYNQETVIDLLDDSLKNRGLFPAGRLDKDTEGLIFLTNDGRLAHNLLSPKKKVDKKYFAIVDKDLEENDVYAFEKGIYLKDDKYMTKPGKLVILSKNTCHVIISEGKYHQVKRMLSTLGKNVTYLKRLEIGPLLLDKDLKLGEYRKLTPNELNELFKVTGQNHIKETNMTEKKIDAKDLEEKIVKAEAEQRAGTRGCEKPSSDLYSDVKERDSETGVEVPTEEAVEEARNWSEENQR